MRKILFLLASGFLAFRPSAFAQVARVTSQQSINELLLTGVVSPAQITANQNNYSPTGIAAASVLRLSTDASRNITGLVAPATAGQVISLLNIGSFPIVLQAENASSTAANRFTLAADYIVASKTSVLLWYDGTTTRWQMLGSSGTSGTLLAANNLSDVLSAATSRTNLGLAIGTNVEAWSATLDTWATKTPPSGTVVGTTDTQSLTNKTETSPKLVTSILDSNGNIYATLTPATTAVNYINYTNAATGNSPTWTATGTDSDISLTWVPKNNGRFITSKLQLGSGVSSTLLTDQVNIYGASAADTRIGARYAGTTSVGPGFDFSLSRGSLGTPTAVQSTDVPFSILVGGYGASVWNNNQASFFAQATENWSSGHLGLKWVFGGTPAGSSTQGTFFTVDSVLSAGTGPTTLTDTTGKILSAALNTVAVGQGGTGLTSGTSGGVLYYSSTSTIASSALLANGGILIGGGAGAAPFTDTDISFLVDTLTVTKLVISGTTASTSTTTGSGVFGGGIGVAGNVFASGDLDFGTAQTSNVYFYHSGNSKSGLNSSAGSMRFFNLSGNNSFSINSLSTADGTTYTNFFDFNTSTGKLTAIPQAASRSAWGAAGTLVEWRGATVTDSSTSGSSTVATETFHSFAVPTLAATNSTVTTTDAANVYIAGGVTAGTNMTITNSWGLWNVGKTRLDGILKSTDTTSGSSTTAAAIVAKSLGLTENAYIGGTLNVTGNTTLSGTNLTIGGNAVSNPFMIINGAAGSLRGQAYRSGGVDRWWTAASSGAESGSNAGSNWILQAYDDAGSSLGNALIVVRSSLAATFGGSITTAAPSGGTAAAWKMGIVSATSPTSPNRTIELDVAGTRYFLAAKTTND